jgi:hypothetical protein
VVSASQACIWSREEARVASHLAGTDLNAPPLCRRSCTSSHAARQRCTRPLQLTRELALTQPEHDKTDARTVPVHH